MRASLSVAISMNDVIAWANHVTFLMNRQDNPIMRFIICKEIKVSRSFSGRQTPVVLVQI
jgi:hypothetical protein